MAKSKYIQWYDTLDRQQRHDLKVKYNLRSITSNNLIRELFCKERPDAVEENHETAATNATRRMVDSHLRRIHGTDGEVSLPFHCAMETPDGTIQMVAYKLSDTNKDDFWVAVEHLKE